jgi:hypothetical protein
VEGQRVFRESTGWSLDFWKWYFGGNWDSAVHREEMPHLFRCSARITKGLSAFKHSFLSFRGFPKLSN